MSALVKEARKKAQEISVIVKQTGNKFVVASSETCQGKRENMDAFVQALRDTKPTNELGKLVLSASDTDLVACLDIPEHLRDVLDKKEWSSALCDRFPFLERGDDTGTWLTFHASDTNEIFPFKLKDEMIQCGIDFLKKRRLVRIAEESDDELEDYAQALGIEW